MTKLVTPEFRGSFVNVLKARAYGEGEPKFSTVIGLPKDDAFWKKMDKAIEDACLEKWGEVPKKLKTFFKDGDEEEEKYGWEGLKLFTASNKSRPGVVVREDGELREPISEDEIYSGAYYRASVRPYAYEYQKSKGVAISLDNIMKVKEGEKFTSRTSANEDFSDFLDD